jgi:hypothetical protein
LAKYDTKKKNSKNKKLSLQLVVAARTIRQR